MAEIIYDDTIYRWRVGTSDASSRDPRHGEEAPVTDLQRGIRHLDAERDGRGWYRYREIPGGPHYRVTGDDLRDLGRRLRRGEPDAYSLWCTETMAEVVR